MFHSILNIAYSDIGLAPWNTVEHYQIASHLGFNALKGDIQVTCDGGLVMCHDCGFTLNNEGRITQFDPAHHIRIADLTFAECMMLEYEDYADTLGHYAKVASYDNFVRICRDTGKYCYTTVRDSSLDVLVSGILKTLETYRMTNQTIINSFTYDTLKLFRQSHQTIALSQVRPPNEILTRDMIDHVAELGHSMICMFSYDPYSFDSPVSYENALEASLNAVTYATSIGVPVYQAQVYDITDHEYLIQNGFNGFHITRPILDYDRHDYQFRILYSSENQTAYIRNIFDHDVYAADISIEHNSIVIKDICRKGYKLRNTEDVLPMLWLNILPYQAFISELNELECSLTINNGVIYITADMSKDGNYLIHIRI